MDGSEGIYVRQLSKSEKGLIVIDEYFKCTEKYPKSENVFNEDLKKEILSQLPHFRNCDFTGAEFFDDEGMKLLKSMGAALDDFAAVWDSKYPKISKSWYDNWANLSTYFKFPQELRKLIYTTNTIEGFNRQLKKVTKAKSVFPTDDSLFKMLYLAMKDITKKWTGRRQDWSSIYAQLVIYYGDRIPD